MIEQLSRANSREIAEVLMDAFRHDPAFIALFKELDGDRVCSFRMFMQMWVRISFHLRHILYGVKVEGILAGVVGVTHRAPKGIAGPIAELIHIPSLLRDMNLSVGLSLARAARRPVSVAKTAAEISMLAVRPSMQGRGLATMLLNTAHASLAGNDYTGPVYVYTTAAGSKAFYVKQGYRLISTARAASVDVFHLLYTTL